MHPVWLRCQQEYGRLIRQGTSCQTGRNRERRGEERINSLALHESVKLCPVMNGHEELSGQGRVFELSFSRMVLLEGSGWNAVSVYSNTHPHTHRSVEKRIFRMLLLFILPHRLFAVEPLTWGIFLTVHTHHFTTISTHCGPLRMIELIMCIF